MHNKTARDESYYILCPSLLICPSRILRDTTRVSGTAELAQIDQRVGQQLHPIMPPLDTFKSDQQSFELIFPGKGPFDTHAQRMHRGIEEPLASALGALAVARILGDVGNQVLTR